ncbi:MAG TPA: hypothetical protein OIM60_05105 [Clostridiaceae bacterium]|jgi:hypothetical protein|nr:hypothetical protein [Clostridiaceae bacterium]
MAKNIIKEIIIMLLLCLAIILILGVILYEYVPSNKILPEEVSYVTPQNIKEELNSSNSVEEDKVILTYEIDESDLANYQRIKDYKPGKVNPFSTYEEKTEENQSQNGQNTTNNNSGSTNSDNSSSTGGNTQNSVQNSNTSSEGTYFPDKGTK